jgi:hypothetical protein
MLEKNFESKIFTDSKNLFNHLIDFRNTEDCSIDYESLKIINESLTYYEEKVKLE